MSKQAMLWIIVIIVVIIGIVLFTRSGGDVVTKDSTATVSQSERTSTAQSLKDLIAANRPQQCTVTTSTDAGESTGTVYVAGGKMRGDFSVRTNNVSVASHMISDGSTNYIWTDGQPQGFKMSLEESATAGTGTAGASEYQAFDYNAALNYKCESWSGDQSLFALPSGVTFVDMKAMMEAQLKGMMPADTQ